MENETEIEANDIGPADIVRRRGRPPKTIGGEIKPEQERTTADTEAVEGGIMVTLVRGYVPRNRKPDANGVLWKSKAGEQITVSMKDAMYLCSHGIAKVELDDK